MLETQVFVQQLNYASIQRCSYRIIPSHVSEYELFTIVIRVKENLMEPNNIANSYRISKVR